MGSRRYPGWRPVRTVAAGARVARVEVFFDLVFVYGFFNVSRFVAEDLSTHGLVKGMLVLALLWLCWIAHMLVAQRVRLGEGIAPLVTLTAMGAVLGIALSIPQAFGDQSGGGPAPVLFPICYFLIRGLHLGLHLYAVRDLPEERRQLVRIGLAVVVSTGLLLAAAFVPDLPGGTDRVWVRPGIWALAVLVEYGNGFAVGLSGWRIAAPGHFVERFELIVIIAFGELIISIGLGSGVLGQPVTWPTFYTTLAGLAAIVSLWWLYFDSLAPAAELAMHGRRGPDRIAAARDGYLYLHLPMIAGLILVALGGEQMVHHLGAAGVDLLGPLPGPGGPLLFTRAALYLVSLVAFQLRVLGTVVWTRVTVVVLVVAAVPVAGRLPALVAVALLTVLTVGLVVAEIVLLAGSRWALHEAVREEREAREVREARWRHHHR
ncbi:low temperature requirement protein A [Micromonospora sp. PTRAS2]